MKCSILLNMFKIYLVLVCRYFSNYLLISRTAVFC